MNYAKEIERAKKELDIAESDVDFVKEFLPSIYKGRINFINKKKKYIDFLKLELIKEI